VIETTSFRVDAAPSIGQHGQVGLRLAMTVASIVGLTWLAGRVYANAALRLGTRVRFRDAFRG
jgi:hypothetical protein